MAAREARPVPGVWVCDRSGDQRHLQRVRTANHRATHQQVNKSTSEGRGCGMRRRLIKLAVFLLLGAIVNVAVAWVGPRCPVFDPRASNRVPTSVDTLLWHDRKPPSFAEVPYVVDQRSTWVCEHQSLVGWMKREGE